MRALTTLQNSISIQACSNPSFFNQISNKAKLTIGILAVGILFGSGNAKANDCNNSSLNPGSVIGSMVGGAIGKQVKGNQRTTATAVGAAIGGVVGNDIYKDGCNNTSQPRYGQNNSQGYTGRIDPQYERERQEMINRQRAHMERQAEMRDRRAQQSSSYQGEISCDRPTQSNDRSRLNKESVAGAVIGGLVGRELNGDGKNRSTATAAGAAIGAVTGDYLNERNSAQTQNCVIRAPRNDQDYRDQDYRDQGQSSRMQRPQQQAPQIEHLSSMETSTLNSFVDQTMVSKQIWENSMQEIATASRSSSTKQQKELLKRLNKEEQQNRTNFVESRDRLFTTFENVASVGNRDITKYTPIIMALNQIPTEGVISISGLMSKERELRSSYEYNQASIRAKNQVPIHTNQTPIKGATNVAL